MKILILTRNIPNPLSGGDNRPYYLIKHLSENFGHEITLFSLDRETPKERYVEEMEDKCASTKFFEINLPNVNMIQKLVSLKNTFSPGNLHSKNGDFEPLGHHLNTKMQREVDETIEREDFDIILSDSVPASYVSKSKLPKIVDPRDAKSENWRRRAKRSKGFLEKVNWYIFYLKIKYVESRIFEKFDFCVTVTEQDKKRFEDVGLRNIKIIPNGVDTSFFKPSKTEEEFPSVVYTGLMRGVKNTNAVIYFYSEIFPKILEEFPETKFYIVGKDPTKEIKELNSDDSVVVTGFVEDVKEYLAKSSVFICPMYQGTGIKNKVLEAMAMGKPIVTTSTGTYGIDAQPGRDFLVSDAPKKFTEHVLRLFKDRKLRDELGSNAREVVEERYSWGKIAEKMNKLITQITEN